MAYKNFATAEITPEDDVGPAGTIVFPYPQGTTVDSFTGGDPEQGVVIINNSNRFQGTDYVTFAYGATEITATNAHDSGVWPAGYPILFQMPKTPLVTGDAQDVIDQAAAVFAAAAGIADLASPADEPTTTAKINEIIAALKAT